MLQREIYPSHINNCEELMQEMKNKRIAPDIVFYNVLLQFKLKERQFEDAQKLFEDICSRFSPNSSTLTIMLSYYAKQSLDIELILTLFKTHNVEHHKQSLTVLMNYYAGKGDVQTSLKCFGRMIGYDFSFGKRVEVKPWQKADRAAVGMMIKIASAESQALLVSVYQALDACEIIHRRKF
jgi:PPR repeat family/PPR repeat